MASRSFCQGGVEPFSCRGQVFDVYTEGLTGLPKTPVIGNIHFHEGRNMEGLGKPVWFPTPARVLIHAFRENIAVLFSPRGIVDFGHGGLHVPVLPVVKVIETDRVEAMAEIAQMGQESDRTPGSTADPLLDEIPHGMVQGYTGVPQMIPSPQVGQVNPIHRPEPCSPEKTRQLLKVQIHHEQPVLEVVLHGRESPVPDLPRRIAPPRPRGA